MVFLHFEGTITQKITVFKDVTEVLESILGHFLRLQEAAWTNTIVNSSFTGHFIPNPSYPQLTGLQGIKLHYNLLI